MLSPVKKILAAVLPLSLSPFLSALPLALLRMRFSGLSKPSSIYVRTETSRGQNGLGVVYHNNNACCQGMWMNGTGEHWLLEPVFLRERTISLGASCPPQNTWTDGWGSREWMWRGGRQREAGLGIEMRSDGRTVIWSDGDFYLMGDFIIGFISGEFYELGSLPWLWWQLLLFFARR